MAVTLDFRSSTGLHLQEHQEQNVCFFTLDTPSETLRFSVHPQQAPVVPDFTYPRPLQELLDSGRDLLAEELLARGEPDYASVAGLLPPLTEGAYCSGFIWRIYKDFGYSVPRTSYGCRTAGTGVSYAEAQPGDIICYAGHVGLYIGNGQIVHASTQKTGIKITRATYREILTVRRIV